MQESIDFSNLPHSYLMCIHRECPKAPTCLRQLAEQNVSAYVERWAILSPKYLAALDGACPHYRSSQKLRYAMGFINMLEHLPHNQMRVATTRLMSYFGRTSYYRVRKGERLLSPAEQQKVLNILKQCGASAVQEFDRYLEEYDW